MSTSQTIYDHAKKDMGLTEVAGPGSSPRIQLAIKQSADWLDRDDSKTPWCGCIRGLWGIETATGVPKEHFRAASWEKWGKAVDINKPEKWQQGDTIIMSRPGGKHVTLLHEARLSDVLCLGGNQSNKVNITSFHISKIIAVRR